MEKERRWFSEYLLVIAVIVLAGLSFFIATRNPDIAFAKRVFGGLIEGKESIQNSIDWHSFQALGNDVATDYLKLANEQQKAYYRKAFILNFSLIFKSAGGRLSSYTNWRIYAKNKERAVVACGALSKRTLLFTISKRQSKRKLVALQWKD